MQVTARQQLLRIVIMHHSDKNVLKLHKLRLFSTSHIQQDDKFKERHCQMMSKIEPQSHPIVHPCTTQKPHSRGKNSGEKQKNLGGTSPKPPAPPKKVEYYFSKENLKTDAFLVSKMDSSLFVSIDVLTSFKKAAADQSAG